jgi:hypothetical protein
VASFNVFDEDHDAFGERVSIDLLAPGENLNVLDLDNTVVHNAFGTSHAAPHVTGAIAHLRQYANYWIPRAGEPHWNVDRANRHEVIKAVLLNSADKLNGIHGSKRNIQLQGGAGTWINTQAANNMSIPLDEQMGAGHLNVGNALRNYRTGEWDAGLVPNIGWDYGTVGASGSYNIYEFKQPIPAGEVVAATLCWDLRIQTISPDQDEFLDGFFPYSDLTEVLTDLDIYLMPAGADPNDTEDIIWASVSSVDNVEHIFFPVQETGMYQLVVINTPFGLDDGQDYGLAWWAGEALSGDFDADGDVDGDDLDEWKIGFNGGGNGDADSDGDSDGADFLAWQRNFGTGVSATPASVPEPGALLLIAFGLPPVLRRRAA